MTTAKKDSTYSSIKKWITSTSIYSSIKNWVICTYRFIRKWCILIDDMIITFIIKGVDSDRVEIFIKKWLTTTNHKNIGTLYLIFAGVAGISGIVLFFYVKYIMRYPDAAFYYYDGRVTKLVFYMIGVLVVQSLIGGCVNRWWIPFIGASETASPRINYISFWLLTPSLLLLILSALYEGGMFTDKFFLTTIISRNFGHTGLALDMVHLSFLLSKTASNLKYLNFLATIIVVKTEKLKFCRSNEEIVKSLLFLYFLLLVPLPWFINDFQMLFSPRGFFIRFYNPIVGKYVWYPHIFWYCFYFAESYIIFLPFFCVISHIFFLSILIISENLYLLWIVRFICLFFYLLWLFF